MNNRQLKKYVRKNWHKKSKWWNRYCKPLSFTNEKRYSEYMYNLQE